MPDDPHAFESLPDQIEGEPRLMPGPDWLGHRDPPLADERNCAEQLSEPAAFGLRRQQIKAQAGHEAAGGGP